MATFRVEARSRLHDDHERPLTDSEQLAEIGEQVMHGLTEVGASDPFVLVEFDAHVLEIWVSVTADDELQAIEDAVRLIRAAVRAAGQSALVWERSFHDLRPVAQLQSA